MELDKVYECILELLSWYKNIVEGWRKIREKYSDVLDYVFNPERMVELPDSEYGRYVKIIFKLYDIHSRVDSVLLLDDYGLDNVIKRINELERKIRSVLYKC